MFFYKAMTFCNRDLLDILFGNEQNFAHYKLDRRAVNLLHSYTWYVYTFLLSFYYVKSVYLIFAILKLAILFAIFV